MNTRLLVACLAAVFSNSVAAQEQEQVPPVRWQQSPLIFLPGEGEAGERLVAEGEAIVEFPLRWALSARITETVVLQRGEEELTLDAGSLLPMVDIGGNGRYAARTAFCTRSRVAEAQEGSGFMGLMFGSMLNTLQDMVVCLEDSDKDSRFDRALVLGDGPGIVELGPIAPQAFTVLGGEPLGTDDDLVRFTLLRVGRSVVQMQIDIMQRGSIRNFSTMRSGRFTVGRFPEIRFGENTGGAGNVLGTRFEVVAAERRENRATLRWSPAASRDEFVVIPDEVVTTYGW